MAEACLKLILVLRDFFHPLVSDLFGYVVEYHEHSWLQIPLHVDEAYVEVVHGLLY